MSPVSRIKNRLRRVGLFRFLSHRESRSHLLWILAGCMLLVAEHACAQQTVAEQYLFQAANAARAGAGLPALQWSDRLSRVAGQHALAMQAQDTVAHQFEAEPDLPERVAAGGVRFSAVAENLGVALNAVELQQVWLQSPDHRANILDPSVNSLGIAVRQSRGEVWAVADFARTAAQLSLGEQEASLAMMLRGTGIAVTAEENARAMCRQATGYLGARPLFVMRFTFAELTHLPEQLMQRLGQGKATRAAVGACESPAQSFASYSAAVVLYR